MTTAVPHLRIVDDDLWEQAKARQVEMRRVTSNGHSKRFNHARRPKYLFSGLTKCADDYRLLEQIAYFSRWEYRYCCQSNKALAYFAAQADPKNIGRSLSNLLGAGVVAGIDVPRQIGGWPVTYYTLRCTAEDRSTQTIGNLNAAFKASVASRHPDDLLPSSRPPEDENPGQVVQQTTCKSSAGVVASRPPDAQTVNKRNVNREHHGADAPVDATLPLEEPGQLFRSKRTSAKPASLTDREIDAAFDEWYAAYPRKMKPLVARKAYTKAIKEHGATPAQLLAALKVYPFKTPAGGEDYRPGTRRAGCNAGSWMEVELSATTSKPIDPEAALQRLAASDVGKAWIAKLGPEKGMEKLRSQVAAATKAGA